ncbi:MAG: SDR family oxidoreductase [Actinotalea sp.]|nr:SDR family oxidoreductase [Actinotalea sp.]
MQISGKVFVVTGGGNGIGREVVLALLGRGARVATFDISEDGLAETGRLADAGDRLTTHRVDITDRAAVEAFRDAAVAAHGHVDGLLNVAGIIQRFVRINDLSHEEIARVMDVNFWGVVTTTKAFLPHLLERPSAAVVNVASMGALAPVPGQAAYGASKAAVKLFTEALYAELRGSSVAVTVVFPGGVATNIAHNSGATVPGHVASSQSARMTTTAPADAAAQIIGGMEKGAYRVTIGKDAQGLDRLSRIAPRRATEMIADKMKALLS